MAHGIRWIGLDVHAHESTMAVFDPRHGPGHRAPGRRAFARAVAVAARVPRPARMVYEAGPTGHGLARRARKGSRSCLEKGDEKATARFKGPNRRAATCSQLRETAC